MNTDTKILFSVSILAAFILGVFACRIATIVPPPPVVVASPSALAEEFKLGYFNGWTERDSDAFANDFFNLRLDIYLRARPLNLSAISADRKNDLWETAVRDRKAMHDAWGTWSRERRLKFDGKQSRFLPGTKWNLD